MNTDPTNTTKIEVILVSIQKDLEHLTKEFKELKEEFAKHKTQFAEIESYVVKWKFAALVLLGLGGAATWVIDKFLSLIVK